MVAAYIAGVSGWVMIVLLIVTILYPFLCRWGVPGPVQSFLKRMRFHYWLGYIIATLVIIHAWIAMSDRMSRGVNATGLYLGTLALLLVFTQVLLGRRLSWPKLSVRPMLRRWHFWVMIGIVTLVSAHVVLDGQMLHMLLLK
jgi:hypothetical protein